MKKIYIIPNTQLTAVGVHHMVAESIKIDGTQDISNSKAWTKQDNGWDLWGDDNDFDN